METAVSEKKRSIGRINLLKSTRKSSSNKHKIKDKLTISNEYVGKIIGLGGQVDDN